MRQSEDQSRLNRHSACMLTRMETMKWTERSTDQANDCFGGGANCINPLGLLQCAHVRLSNYGLGSKACPVVVNAGSFMSALIFAVGSVTGSNTRPNTIDLISRDVTYLENPRAPRR